MENPDGFLGTTRLPEPVPRLGSSVGYRVGGGRVIAAGAGDGVWQSLTGPWYTGASFFTRESLSVEIDGKLHPLRCEMARTRQTGVYQGRAVIGDIEIRLMDAAPWQQPWITRLVRLRNPSAQSPHTLRIHAHIDCDSPQGIQAVADFGDDDASGDLSLCPPPGSFCMSGRPGWVPDWIDRRLRIGFADVIPSFALERIPPGRARDLVEGGLSCIKTNQSADGGMVATIPVYPLTWTRDTYCGLRGLLATGHTDEYRQFLRYMHRKFLAHGFIPNAMACGSDSFALYNGTSQNNPNRRDGASSPCPESNTAAETPALLILAARDYRAATGDDDTLAEMDVTLRHSLDIQLKHAVANDYRLESSGDETELCGAVSTAAAGYDGHPDHHWSMASMALAIASIDFFIAYERRRGRDPGRYRSVMEGRTYEPEQRRVPLVPVEGDGRYLGHTLGYLLWSLAQTRHPDVHRIYDALVNGPSADAWGAFAEAYDADGAPNRCRVRTFETGVNIDAVAAYHGLGSTGEEK